MMPLVVRFSHEWCFFGGIFSYSQTCFARSLLSAQCPLVTKCNCTYYINKQTTTTKQTKQTNKQQTNYATNQQTIHKIS